jgi:signal transduction histidine kinase/HAMP domain-containing protein
MSLRAKLIGSFLAVVPIVILAVSLLEIGRTMTLNVNGVGRSGDLLVHQIFEQMRAALMQPHAAGLKSLQGDDALRALLMSSRAFGIDVVSVRIETPDGVSVMAAPAELEGRRVAAANPFRELKALADSWWPLGAIGPLWVDRNYEISRPVSINGRAFAVIKVDLSTGLSVSEVHRSVAEILGIGAGAILTAAMMGALIGRLLLRPITAIAAGLEELTAGQTEVKVEVGGQDELSSLAQKFNLLSQKIRSDRVQWENERGQLLDAFRSIADAVLLIDSHGFLLFANAEAEGQLGLPAGGVAEGKSLSVLLGKRHPLTNLIETVFAAGTEVHDVALQMDGNTAPERFLVSVLGLGRGKEHPGLLVILRDLGPVRELENVIDYSDRLARLGGLISGVAHQIRNPLYAMTLEMNLLSEAADKGNPIDHHIRTVSDEIRRLDQAVKALMRFLRPEQLNLSEFVLDDLLEEVGSHVADSKVKIEYRKELTRIRIAADRALLSEALTNVVQNAAQAMPEGGTVVVETRLSVEGWIEIAVSDRGKGIAREDLGRIFELYFTNKENGNGLGLPMAQRAVDLHRGMISVDSELGLGTTVRIRLPIAPPTREPGPLARAATD